MGLFNSDRNDANQNAARKIDQKAAQRAAKMADANNLGRNTVTVQEAKRRQFGR